MNYIELEKRFLREIYRIQEIAAFDDPKSIEACSLKLMEEVGELSEQVLVLQGHIKKPVKEPIEGEVADVINCVLSVLVKAYPEKNVYEIFSLLTSAMAVKNQKWLEGLRNT